MKMSGRTPSPTLDRSLGPSGHVDDFARRNLPPSEQWPDLLLDRPEFQYPEYLNAAVELTDRIVEKGWGDRIALIGNGRQRTYKELADWSNRLADELVGCAKTSKFLKQVVNFDGTSNHDAELDRVALNKSVKFDAVKTGR